MAEVSREKVQQVVDKLKGFLQADGGDIELIGIEGGIVKVKLVGACSSCPMSKLTLKRGVEAAIKKEVPEVVSVENVDTPEQANTPDRSSGGAPGRT